jgi:protein SCO1
MNRRNCFRFLAAPAAALAFNRTAKEAKASVVRAVGMGKFNIPNVQVTSHEGHKYHFYEDLVQGKTVLINFFYADCSGICPTMTSNLLKIQKALGSQMGRDTFIYSISLKPEKDSPKKLREYAEMHGIKPGSGWLLLNAHRPDMDTLRERMGFKDSDPVLDADINQHTGILRFGTDVYDHWSGYPLLGKVDTIVEMVKQLDPKYERQSLY